MPYTVSHAAVVIPLNRKPLVPSAVIIGSMSPDFLYFLPGMPHNHFTHTLFGLMIFCLPVSLVTFYLFDRGLRNPLNSLLPLELRWPGETRPDAASLLFVTMSVLIGAATHIAWDSFTHASGFMVHQFDRLTIVLFNAFGQPIHVFKLLQYASTVVGGLVLVVWTGAFVHARLRTPVAYRSALRQMVGPLVFLFVCGVIGFVASLDDFGERGFKALVVTNVVTTMSLCGMTVLCYAAIWHLRRSEHI